MGLAETLRGLVYNAILAANVGQVFKVTKNWTEMDAFETDATYDGRINFWMITVGAEEREQSLFGSGNKTRRVTISAHGYTAYDTDGAAEALLANQSETVMDALDAATTLHGEFASSSSYEADLAQRGAVEQVEFRAGASYLLNHVEVTQKVAVLPLG